MSPGPFVTRRTDVDPFLLAEVGTEPNGMVLTVMSMLARYGRDPWEEADHLATLCEATATEELAQIIVRSQTRCGGLVAATAIAARLISLLPSRSEVSNSLTAAKPQAPKIGWIGTAVLYGVLAASLALNTVAERARTADAEKGQPATAPKLEPHPNETSVHDTPVGQQSPRAQVRQGRAPALTHDGHSGGLD